MDVCSELQGLELKVDGIYHTQRHKNTHSDYYWAWLQVKVLSKVNWCQKFIKADKFPSHFVSVYIALNLPGILWFLPHPSCEVSLNFISFLKSSTKVILLVEFVVNHSLTSNVSWSHATNSWIIPAISQQHFLAVSPYFWPVSPLLALWD